MQGAKHTHGFERIAWRCRKIRGSCHVERPFPRERRATKRKKGINPHDSRWRADEVSAERATAQGVLTLGGSGGVLLGWHGRLNLAVQIWSTSQSRKVLEDDKDAKAIWSIRQSRRWFGRESVSHCRISGRRHLATAGGYPDPVQGYLQGTSRYFVDNCSCTDTPSYISHTIADPFCTSSNI
jgi:hypothetical protein